MREKKRWIGTVQRDDRVNRVERGSKGAGESGRRVARFNIAQLISSQLSDSR